MHYAFLCLLRLSHDQQSFLNVLIHVDMFSGMYTSQGSGDILLRMYGSWDKIMVDQRSFRRILKPVKQCIMPFYAFLSPSVHVWKVGEFRATSAHFQSTFRALFKQLTILC